MSIIYIETICEQYEKVIEENIDTGELNIDVEMQPGASKVNIEQPEFSESFSQVSGVNGSISEDESTRTLSSPS